MRRQSRTASILRNRVFLGAIISAIVATGVYVSYGALKGLPFQPKYKISVEVPDAKQLSPGDQVRIGGARVGIVDSITAEDPAHPYARIDLSIFGHRTVPIDSTASVTPISILGGKSVEITRGRAEQQIPEGGTIPLRQATPTVDLNDALSTFDSRTRRGLRGLIGGLGDGLAGRGPAINEAIAEIRPLLPPLRRVLTLVASPQTDVPGFIDGAYATMDALRPVSGLFPEMLTNAATTFEALDRADPALGQTIDRLPGAESASTRTLTRATPVLADLAALTRELRPATARLPRTTRRLDAALRAAPPTLELARAAAPGTGRLATTLLRALPPRSAALRDSLIGLDETVRTISSIFSVIGPAQQYCNLFGVALRNNADAVSQSDANGGWINLIPIFASPLLLQRGSTNSDTHQNFQPIADERGCTIGKNDYKDKVKQIGNPPSFTKSFEATVAPQIATDRGRAAGLLTPTPGTRLP